MSIDPVAFLLLAAGCDPLAVAVPESHVEEAPVDSLAADVPTPSVVHIVFELALVDEVVALSAQALHPAIFVDLPKGALGVVLADSQVVVHRAVSRCVADNVFGV